MSTRVVRRAPLRERIAAKLDPQDFVLWLSEELNSKDWEDFNRSWSATIGLGLNLIFILARTNSIPSSSGDDVFSDGDGFRAAGWLAWIVRDRADLLLQRRLMLI
jgi:hypothetical protein